MSVYSGWLAYSTLIMNGLSIKLKILTVEEVLIKTGLDCTSNHYKSPENMEVLIGWTGSPASSPHFVSESETFEIRSFILR